jgi:hypothetical protein
MLEMLFNGVGDDSSDESIAGSPGPSSIAKPDNSSFDNSAFPFSIDDAGDRAVYGSADTAFTSAETPPEKSSHAPNVEKRPLKLRPSILKKPRSDPEQVDPLKFLHVDPRLLPDEFSARSGLTEQSLSRVEGSIVTFSDKITIYAAYDPDEDPSYKPDLDGTKGDLKSEADVSLNSAEGMTATEASAHFEEKRGKAEQYEVQKTEKSEESAKRKRVEVFWNRSKWVNNAAVSSDLAQRREIANQLIIIEGELWLPKNNMKGGYVLKAARVREVEDSQESLVKTSAMMGDLPTGDPLETPTVQEIQDFYRNLCYDIKDLLNYCNRSEPGELIANLQKIALPE